MNQLSSALTPSTPHALAWFAPLSLITQWEFVEGLKWVSGLKIWEEPYMCQRCGRQADPCGFTHSPSSGPAASREDILPFETLLPNSLRKAFQPLPKSDYRTAWTVLRTCCSIRGAARRWPWISL